MIAIVCLLWGVARADVARPFTGRSADEARVAGGDALVKLLEYRARVERGAYRETLRLCATYPFARFNPEDAPDPGLAWLEVFGRGLVQPLSLFTIPGYAGLKALYNSFNHTRIWQFDAWLRSVHVLYLTNSRGFAEAAVKCLGTESPRAIKSFAFAITAIDIAGSLLTGEILLVPINQALGYLVRVSAGVWSGHVPAWLARQGVGYAAWTVLPIGAVNLAAYLNHLRQARDAADSIIDNGVVARDRAQRVSRQIVMTRALDELRRARDTDDMSRFETWVGVNLTRDIVRRAHGDQRAVLMNPAPTAADDTYRSVLEIILPVLDQLDLA